MSYLVLEKDLFYDPQYANLSVSAKVLYAFLADRASLSKKNGEKWLTKEGETFVIFPQNEIMCRLGCGHDKATSLLRELEAANLIKRYRQGCSKPYKIVVNTAIMDTAKKHKGRRETTFTNSDKNATNNTEENNTDISDNNLHMDQHVAETIIKENIRYDVLRNELNQAILDNVISVMVDTLLSTAKTMTVSGKQYKKEEVNDSLMRVDDMYVRYICYRLENEPHMVYSPRGYILRRLFDEPHEIDLYYDLKLSYDMRQEGIVI